MVVANTLTKSIQKQIRSIDDDKVGSKTFNPVLCRINHLLISRSNLQASETERRSKGVLFTNISRKYFSDSISSFIV